MKAGRFLTGVMGLLAALSLGGFADGLDAPRVTLSVTDEPLTNVLERIAEQAGVSIVMTNEVAGRESISMRVRNAELENALDQALSDYNYTLSFSAEQNVISKVVVAVQEKKEGMSMQASFPAVQVTGNRPSRTSSELMSSDLNAYAETYHKVVTAEQKPTVYPEGVTQKDIEGTKQELVKLVHQRKVK